MKSALNRLPGIACTRIYNLQASTYIHTARGSRVCVLSGRKVKRTATGEIAGMGNLSRPLRPQRAMSSVSALSAPGKPSPRWGFSLRLRRKTLGAPSSTRRSRKLYAPPGPHPAERARLGTPAALVCAGAGPSLVVETRHDSSGLWPAPRLLGSASPLPASPAPPRSPAPLIPACPSPSPAGAPTRRAKSRKGLGSVQEVSGNRRAYAESQRLGLGSGLGFGL